MSRPNDIPGVVPGCNRQRGGDGNSRSPGWGVRNHPGGLVEWGDWTAWAPLDDGGEVSEAYVDVDGYEAMVRVVRNEDGCELAPVISAIVLGHELSDAGKIPADLLEELRQYGRERLEESR